MPDNTPVTLAFTDPLGIQPNHGQGATPGTETYQRICDRLWLLVREFRYPVFDNPTLDPNTVLVTRWDPNNMAPIERGDDRRSEFLRPCIHANGPDLIRALVDLGRPPISSTGRL